MPNDRSLYYKLFAAAADTLDALEHANYAQAKDLLIRAQQEAENAWLSAEPDENTAADP